MSSVPVLYHAERSSCSQRCRLVLAEKGITYKEEVLTLFFDQHDPNFLRNVNPKGTVPVMQHDGKYFRDSRDIVGYVDTLPSEHAKLSYEDVPEKAIRVLSLTDRMNGLNVPVLTFGSMFHRQFTQNSLAPISLTMESFAEMAKKKAENLKQVAADHPDLADTVNVILKRSQGFKGTLMNELILKQAIDECDIVLDDMEKELKQQKSCAGGGEYWLCGDRFSMADVYLSVVLHRLVFVGLAEQLFLSKRPLLTNYYQRVLERPSFKEKCVAGNDGKQWIPQN